MFDKTGIDISDFDFVLSSNDIAHIFNKHGNEATESQLGQRAVTENDFENIIETVISPDDVSSSPSHNNVSALKFTKNLNGKNIAITIVSNKKSTLTLKSAWIIESGRRTPSTNAEALARTSKTNSGKPTTNSISETTEKVNSKGKKSENKRYALSIDGENVAVGKFFVNIGFLQKIVISGKIYRPKISAKEKIRRIILFWLRAKPSGGFAAWDGICKKHAFCGCRWQPEPHDLRVILRFAP